MTRVTHLVFDLGGVIVELRGSPIRPEWFTTHISNEEIWDKWLVSDSPRAFESGSISPDEFANRVVKEFTLQVSAEDFLDYFTTLPKGRYPGAKELLQAVAKHYSTALFSNSNVLHWERKMVGMELQPLFDFHFGSHLIGHCKPDQEAFEKVLNKLGVPASQILFLDDNQRNVEAARSAGMFSERVVGVDETIAALNSHKIRFEL